MLVAVDSNVTMPAARLTEGRTLSPSTPKVIWRISLVSRLSMKSSAPARRRLGEAGGIRGQAYERAQGVEGDPDVVDVRTERRRVHARIRGIAGGRVGDLAQERRAGRRAGRALAARRLVGAAGVLRRALGAVEEALVPDEDLVPRSSQGALVGKYLGRCEGPPVAEGDARRRLVVGRAGDADDRRGLAMQCADGGRGEEQDGQDQQKTAAADGGLRVCPHCSSRVSRKHAIEGNGPSPLHRDQLTDFPAIFAHPWPPQRAAPVRPKGGGMSCTPDGCMSASRVSEITGISFQQTSWPAPATTPAL